MCRTLTDLEADVGELGAFGAAGTVGALPPPPHAESNEAAIAAARTDLNCFIVNLHVVTGADRKAKCKSFLPRNAETEKSEKRSYTKVNKRYATKHNAKPEIGLMSQPLTMAHKFFRLISRAFAIAAPDIEPTSAWFIDVK